MATATQEQQPFARRTVILLIGIGLSAFVGGMIVMAFSDLFSPNSEARTSTFSISAIGHRAAANFLEDMGFDLITNRRNLERTGVEGATLVLAEPRPGAFSPERLESLAHFPTVVLILPKRSGIPDPLNPNRVIRAPVMPPIFVTSATRPFLDEVDLVSPTESPTWTSNHFAQLVPELPDLQLVQSADLTPLLQTEDGILIGAATLDAYTLIIVSDPDLIANHGLAEGDNAAIFAQLMDMVGGRTILWDETIHGFEISENVWRSAFEPPLLAITIAATLTLCILLLATTYRFGGAIRVPPVIEEGKRSLVETASTLMLAGDHNRELMRRYLANGLRRATRQLNAPRGDVAATNDWLERLAVARGLTEAQARVPRAVTEALANPNLSQARLVVLVRDFYDWRTEILDESE